MKKIIRILIEILIIIMIAIVVFFIIKRINTKQTTVKEENSKEYYKKVKKISSQECVVKIENIEYNDDKSFKKIKSEGYIIKTEGTTIKYDNINKTANEKYKISDKELEKIIKLVKEVDEEEVLTMMTNVAILEGQIITVYNIEKGEEIILKDFYSTNYSSAAYEILYILSDNNLIEEIDKNGLLSI